MGGSGMMPQQPQMPAMGGIPAMGVGVPPQATPAAPEAAPDTAAAPAPEEAEPQKKSGPVTLKLVSFETPKKIAVIKEVRALTNLGLKESKDLVEGVPKVLKKGIPPEEVDAIMEKFKACNAVVEIES